MEVAAHMFSLYFFKCVWCHTSVHLNMASNSVESRSVKYAQRNTSYAAGVGATVTSSTLSTRVSVTSPSTQPGKQKCDPHLELCELFRSDGDPIEFLLPGQQCLRRVEKITLKYITLVVCLTWCGHVGPLSASCLTVYFLPHRHVWALQYTNLKKWPNM